MRIRTHAATSADTRDALAQIERQLVPGDTASLVFAFYGCGHDDTLLHGFLRQRFAGAGLIGGTSSGGVLTTQGCPGPESIALFCIDDPTGDYGVAAGSLGIDAAATAQQLLDLALQRCGCAGELPELVWIYQAPGREEEVLAGLRRSVGDRCPIIGGSSADNDVSGRWRQLGPDGALHDGLVVAVLSPSRPLRVAFQGGYEPVGPSGVVTGIGLQPIAGSGGVATEVSGREIQSIDGEPAAQVYDRWSGGRIGSVLDRGGSILAETTLHPLAVAIGQTDGITHYQLIHPEHVGTDGSLRTFCEIKVGARLYAMRGDRQRLVERGGRVVTQARRALPRGSRAAGALLVYCGGCKLAVGDAIDQVAGAVAAELDGAPFVGCFTFGEQGRVLDRNLHGNLMISAVVFGE